MQNVAADGDRQPADPALVAPDGQCIEQRLSGMLMGAIACIDHRAAHLLGEKCYRAGGRMPNNKNVGPHGVERHRGIYQRLALLHARIGDRHVHHIGTEPLAGQLERGLGSRRSFEEEVDLGAPAQCRGLLVLAAGNLDGLVGAVEKVMDIVLGERLDTQKVSVGKGHGFSIGLPNFEVYRNDCRTGQARAHCNFRFSPHYWGEPPCMTSRIPIGGTS